MTWNLKGIYFEACNCDVACPCVFLSPPTTGECTALVGWHIEKGTYDEVDLDGLNIALAVHAPGTMVETKWRAAAYFDSRADEAQQAALHNIFGGKAGGHPARLAGHIGELLAAVAAPITFEHSKTSYRMTIADVAEAEIEAMMGQGDGPVEVSGHPLCISPGYPARVAKSKRLRYEDHGMAWRIDGKNGFFSPFAYASD